MLSGHLPTITRCDFFLMCYWTDMEQFSGWLAVYVSVPLPPPSSFPPPTRPPPWSWGLSSRGMAEGGRWKKDEPISVSERERPKRINCPRAATVALPFDPRVVLVSNYGTPFHPLTHLGPLGFYVRFRRRHPMLCSASLWFDSFSIYFRVFPKPRDDPRRILWAGLKDSEGFFGTLKDPLGGLKDSEIFSLKIWVSAWF